MKFTKIVVFSTTLFLLGNSAYASGRFHFINDAENTKMLSTEPLKKQLQLKLLKYFPPIKENKSANPISISFGVNALENSLKEAVKVDIATLVTQADVLSLSRKYPQRLKTVQIVVNAPLFQCQLDVFKKINDKQTGDNQQHTAETLGILLNDNSRLLLPEIEAYAKKHSIKIGFLILKNNENIARGFHHLMQQYQTIMIIADNQVNQTSNLEVIFKEAQLMKRHVISSSTRQNLAGINEDCVLSDETIIEDVVRRVIEKFSGSATTG